MILDTEFEIDQEVFVIFENKIFKRNINAINVEVSKYGTKIKFDIYSKFSGEIIRNFLKEEIFKTKKDLLKFLENSPETI